MGPCLLMLMNPVGIGGGTGFFNPIGEQHGPITQRDALVAATVVQWIGTNVGRSFLTEAFRDVGYEVVLRKK